MSASHQIEVLAPDLCANMPITVELGPWYCPRHRIGVQYIKEYLKHRRASEPEEDFDDRMLLYAM
jgi:hypothetical protein